MESQGGNQHEAMLERLEKRIAGRQPAMFAEAKWALSGKEKVEGLFETPPEWVRRTILAYAHYGLGNPRAKPAADVLNTQERKDAATLGLALASDALVSSLPNSYDGKALAEEIGKIASDVRAKVASERKAIEDKVAGLNAGQLVDFENHKLKGIEVLTTALSVREDADDPRIGILYALWIFWAEVRLLSSIPEVDEWLRSILKCQFSSDLTEKICGEIGLKFPRIKKRTK